MSRALVIGICASLAFGPPSSWAQPASTLKPAAGANAAAGQLNDADREFLQELGRMRIGEVESSELAASRGSAPAVRKIADDIVAYHRRTDPALVALAASRGVELPRVLDKARSDYLAALRSKTGSEFDHDFLIGQKSDHEQSVVLYRKVVQAGQDQVLRDFVNTRLGEAQAMQKAVNEAAKTILPDQ